MEWITWVKFGHDTGGEEETERRKQQMSSIPRKCGGFHQSPKGSAVKLLVVCRARSVLSYLVG